ncbi:unnamed protein product, partial [Rotaria sp. Silwood1]
IVNLLKSMTTHLPDQLLQFFYDIALEMTKTDGYKMINHEEDSDKANIVLTIDNQRSLQTSFDHIIYLGIESNEV